MGALETCWPPPCASAARANARGLGREGEKDGGPCLADGQGAQPQSSFQRVWKNFQHCRGSHLMSCLCIKGLRIFPGNRTHIFARTMVLCPRTLVIWLRTFRVMILCRGKEVCWYPSWPCQNYHHSPGLGCSGSYRIVEINYVEVAARS